MISGPEELIEASRAIREEAVRLLHDYALEKTLARYGTVVPTGSYSMDVMTWRDLDLYLAAERFDKGSMYELVHEMAAPLQPFWLEAKSMVDNPEPDFPHGYFVGMETRIVSADAWNIDLFVMSMEDVASAQAEVDRRKNALDPAMKAAVLEIKNHPGYRTRFYSIDVYDAVIQGSVRSMKGFERWLQGRSERR